MQSYGKKREMTTIEVEGREITVSENLDRVVDDWYQLSLEKCGQPGIPVTIKNRREFDLLPHLSHVSTAFPYSDGQVVVLVVALDNTDAIHEATVAHEILHWILNLDGFPQFKDHKRPHNDCEIMLGIVLSHVPLNQRLAEYGFEYLTGVDALADRVVAAITQREDWDLARPELIAKSLLCVDILQNCTPKKRQVLEEAVSINTLLAQCVHGCLDVLSHYDLRDCESIRRAGRKLISFLMLNKFGNYIEYDTIPELRRMLKALPHDQR